MLLRATHLTFGEIATLWAKENVDKPRGLNRHKILDEIKKALRQGEFNFATLTIDEAPRDVLADIDPSRPADLVRVGPSRMVVTRGTLDRMLFPYSDKLTRKLWLEGLRISKDDFGRWCDEQGHKRPEFWFEDDRQVRPGRPSGSTAASSKQSVDPNLNRDSRTKGGKAANYDAGLQQFIDRLFAEFKTKGANLTPSLLRAWLVKNAPKDDGYDPVPEIPDFDDLEFYEEKVWWKNRQGHPKSVVFRSLERYTKRAKDRVSGFATEPDTTRSPHFHT